MAYLSVGTCNEDLCNKMVRYQVLKEDSLILESFIHTDRGDFVIPEERNAAYSDRPYKSSFVHISAPHMYASVMEALDLREGLTFLNVGSGSGYLSCLVSYIIGPTGLCHGIDISEDVVTHSQKATEVWLSKQKSGKSSSSSLLKLNDSIVFITGNCFDIDVLHTSNCCKYDRIYIGAGCPFDRKEFFYSMLADDGVLVLPIIEQSQMIRIKRHMGSVYSTRLLSNVHFAPLVESSVQPHQVAPANQKSIEHLPEMRDIAESDSLTIFKMDVSQATKNCCELHPPIRLPSLLWAPTKARHQQFPPGVL